MEISSTPLLIKCVSRYNYNKAKWEDFNIQMKDLDLLNIINKTTQEVDTEWNKLSKHIQQGVENFMQTNTCTHHIKQDKSTTKHLQQKTPII